MLFSLLDVRGVVCTPMRVRAHIEREHGAKLNGKWTLQVGTARIFILISPNKDEKATKFILEPHCHSFHWLLRSLQIFCYIFLADGDEVATQGIFFITNSGS